MPNPTIVRCASFGLALTLTGLAADPAAARAPAAPRITTVEPAPATDAAVAGRTGAWTAGTAADCTRARRKFWQAGEGWIVRTITTCR